MTEVPSGQGQPKRPVAGFDMPRPPKDGWARSLFERYDLGTNPSMAAIEPVACRLLGDPNPSTMLEGAELVLGRKISDGIPHKNDPLVVTGILSSDTAEERYGIALMVRTAEDVAAENANKK
jgi:hypothetical protein